MKKKLFFFISVLLCFVLLMQSVIGAFATASYDITQKFDETAEKLLSCPTPQVGSVGGEWMIIGLACSDRLTKAMSDGYYKNVVEYVKTKNSNTLHRRKSTDNSRVILALSTIGVDARNVAGFDLTAPLFDFDYVRYQGINGIIWALIALDSKNYPLPIDNTAANPTTRKKLIDSIIAAQLADGGWSNSGEISDPDMTSMSIQALAPYYRYDCIVKNSIDKALYRLSEMITANTGGRLSPDNCSQILVALTSLGIDPVDDKRFIHSSGATLLDTMMTYSVAGGFKHESGGEYDQMSTEQAYYAMTAYDRFCNGKSPLYEMTDIGLLSDFIFDFNYDGKEDIRDATWLQLYIAEYGELDPYIKRIADCNQNGIVDIKDITSFQIHLTF